METIKKLKKIDIAIKDTSLRLKKCKDDIVLLSNKRSILEEQLKSLEIIKEDNNYE